MPTWRGRIENGGEGYVCLGGLDGRRRRRLICCQQVIHSSGGSSGEECSPLTGCGHGYGDEIGTNNGKHEYEVVWGYDCFRCWGIVVCWAIREMWQLLASSTEQ